MNVRKPLSTLSVDELLISRRAGGGRKVKSDADGLMAWSYFVIWSKTETRGEGWGEVFCDDDFSTDTVIIVQNGPIFTSMII